ncbi:molybdenum ABC transporter ATP-binding protein [Aestuariibius sp. 2305UL40-4]|uniref:molybdenum ABC transporter ATP-binding protein n=1 Tax=Aestuariibius violaceus TaxID=3234132 RepID=UPI00345EF070
MTLEVDLRHRLGDFQLEVAFAAPPGVTALYGPSGAGKTSVVNAVAGLLRPDAGRIAVGGEVLFDRAAGIDVPVRARRMGYVFQDGRLFPHLTVRRNLRYGGGAEGFDAVVSLLGIEGLLDRRPARLSGGEKQRVAIGRALLREPRLLLMDEPLASLDARRKAEILPYLDRLAREVRIPILYVSHAMEEVLRLATTLVMIEAGQLTDSGPIAEVLERHPVPGLVAPEGAITVTGTIRSFDARREAEVLTPLGPLWLAMVNGDVGDTAACLIDPRKVVLVRGEAVSSRNAVEVTVDALRMAGREVTVGLKAGEAQFSARMGIERAKPLDLAPGRRLIAILDPQPLLDGLP